MATSILPAFGKFPAEAAVICRLLASFTTLEIDLMHCVQMVRGDFDMVLKAMFLVRSASQRLTMAGAFGRHPYHKLELGKQFKKATSAVKQCSDIRNEYAHCVWYDDLSGELAFVNLENLAKRQELIQDLRQVRKYHVDIALLEAQEAYFVYTDILLIWLNEEGQRRAGKPAPPAQLEPQHMEPPPRAMCKH